MRFNSDVRLAKAACQQPPHEKSPAEILRRGLPHDLNNVLAVLRSLAGILATQR